MATPKKILIQDLEIADEEIARLRKENKNLNSNVEWLESMISIIREENNSLKIENKGLEIKYKGMLKLYSDTGKEIKKLKEENKRLKKDKGDIRQRLIKLEEAQNKLIRVVENKKLKEELEQAIYWKVDYEKAYKQTELKKDELLEENKKLKEEIAELMGERDGKQMIIERLEEQIKDLIEKNTTFKVSKGDKYSDL